ncbi:nuclear transport factor 2 family protein [Sphingobium sp. HBC34]|uniref:Nuclear transport factor 2 family protein n=1 Tax=Sphingobium cyanobacteriorum TaxID=3063954 RepID=A0ABT8ZFZ9_9SPHN|nr:nuclear transport factor 2 family protein [Sphingobium sp. HBC34]MDO7833465.1 nuclear transport factor 2 family protein [Sphingobium sp. HBC34]
MDRNVEAIIGELKDRQDILDCLHRYCRGVDRFDRDAVRSAYHADALDDHGEYVGDVEGFIDWAFDYHARHQVRTLHSIANHLCDIDGDVAHAETYFTFHSVNREAPFQSTTSGRYIDRLERRDGRWGIVRRICVINGFGAFDPDGQAGDGYFVPSTRDRNDPAYMRPLEIDPARLARMATGTA